jgi:hypothetical protein
MLLLSGDTREKVTFLISTTRTKVTFDPEKGDQPGANSGKKVTMRPEKGDFSGSQLCGSKLPGKRWPSFRVFRGSPMETVIFDRSQQSTRRKVTFLPVLNKNKY